MFYVFLFFISFFSVLIYAIEIMIYYKHVNKVEGLNLDPFIIIAISYQITLVLFEVSMFIWINYLLSKYHVNEYQINKNNMRWQFMMANLYHAYFVFA